MAAIEVLERKLLALPLKQRVFLAESLLASVADVDDDSSEVEEMLEADRRDAEIESGQVKALTDADFWREVDADSQ